MKPWCANCRIELPSENSTNAATERLVEFISYHEGYEVKVTVREAILTVFEGWMMMKSYHVKIPASESIEMCSQCTAVLAELYRFYVEFMKLSREASYMQELLRTSILWEFGQFGSEDVAEHDSKKFILNKKNTDSAAGEGRDVYHEGDAVAITPELIPKVQIQTDEGEEVENDVTQAQADDDERDQVSKPKRRRLPARPAPQRFPCGTCEKEFTRKTDVQRHIRTVHETNDNTAKRDRLDGEEDLEDAEFEDVELDDEDRFLRESQKYAAEFEEAAAENKSLVFTCDQCDKTFRRKDYLKAHEKSHMSVEDKKKELAQRRAIERLHSRSKARKPRKRIPKRKPGKSRRKFTFRCTECDQCFPTRETMKYHRRKVHPKNSFPCSGCDRIFHSENDLKIHENVKHGVGEKLPDRICPVPGCGKYFALPNIMKRHVQSVHCEDKDRIFECPFCPLKFPIKNRLDTHLKNRHNADNSLQSLRCDYCERVYETKSGLSQHIETVHTKLKVYTCDICGRTSIRPEWLRKHLELHDNNREKKFECDSCEMKFYRQASLKKHMKNHSGGKNYLCSECGDKFRQTSSLRRHIEAKHSMKNGPFTCDQCGKSFKIKEYLAQHLRAKSHGGRGHGLYTPAGKKRLERERQQHQQQEVVEIQEQDQVDQEQPLVESESESLISIKHDGSSETTTTTAPLLSPSSLPVPFVPIPLQQPQHQQQQHLILPEGARLVFIDGQHHLLQPASAPVIGRTSSGSTQQQQVIELVITNSEPQISVSVSNNNQNPNSITSPLLRTSTSMSTSTSAIAPLPSTTFQQTPIQFLTTVNPTWFQHHSITQIPQHVAAAAAAAAAANSSTGSTATTASSSTSAPTSSAAVANIGTSSSNQFF